MNLKKLIFTAKNGVIKHSPTILLVMGIGGMLTSVVWAVKETPKALKAIKEVKMKKSYTTETAAIIPAPTVKETIKATWRYYLPSAIIFAASTACLIGGHTVSAKRNAALASVYAITETTLRQYKDAIVENVAPEVKEKIEETVSQKQIQRAPDPRDTNVMIIDKDGVLCYEPITGRYFKSSKEIINASVNEINHEILCDGFGGTASLNDFFDKIALPESDVGNELGWNTSNGLMGVIFSSQIAPDGTPALVIKYDKPPIYRFDRY